MLILSNFLSSSPLRTLLLVFIFATIQLFSIHLVHAESSPQLSVNSQPQDPASQYQLAQAYELGTDLPKNIDDAFYWYSQSADNGNAAAQFTLGEWYLAGTSVEQDNKQALKWFIKAALQGNKQAPLEVAKIYESSFDKELLQPLDAAQLWYEAALKDNPNAEDGYNRVLEAQFNQQRAKQISSIEQLDDSIDSEIDTSQGLSQQVQSSQMLSDQASRSNLSSSNLTSSDYMIGAALALLIAVVSISATLVISRKRQVLKSGELNQQQQTLEAQLSSKDFTIKQQKRQLQTIYHELKKQKNSKSRSQLQVACALFGYTPSSIPDQKSIKLRYKQLSKIYHPDGHGCDEEMKRLNNALKTILQSVTKP
ncbi:J domain-containing protein [Vibrio sp. Isolate33]|uniref:J domain-containing protein n=1 Tax=Vibrio sp. Isolate33 TaxID=2908539 RepID=UPI001EFCA467|nr:J domain-containing protein [Vibrio sp. Isolate33]MCG9542898.1 J domain-containing protein [Vibrio sp. Isolate33]